MTQEWIHFAFRLFHLIAGIMWIGTSFYFVWMDGSFVPSARRADPEGGGPGGTDDGVEGELHMVHGGFFYRVEKRRPMEMPKLLHWFKYESLLTFISGFFLLGIVYWSGGALALMDLTRDHLTQAQAIGVSVGSLVVCWVVYDLVWILVGRRAPILALCLTLTGLVGAIYGLCQVFPGRAAFTHVGAMLGTIMVANVWIRILPNQRRMIAASLEGQAPDWARGLAAKHRSMHNSYMTIPVLMMMVTNHFSFVFDHPLNWVLLCGLCVVGASVRHLMITLERGQPATWAIGPLVVALVAIVALTRPEARAVDGTPPVAFAEVNQIFQRRCTPCHSSTPTDDVFKAAPGGLTFDSSEHIISLASRIRLRVVEARTMPFANKTGMTDEEREIVRRWVDQGARP